MQRLLFLKKINYFLINKLIVYDILTAVMNDGIIIFSRYQFKLLNDLEYVNEDLNQYNLSQNNYYYDMMVLLNYFKNIMGHEPTHSLRTRLF